MVASKLFSDVFFTNTRYAKVSWYESSEGGFFSLLKKKLHVYI
jgi:hypothetical protein